MRPTYTMTTFDHNILFFLVNLFVSCCSNVQCLLYFGNYLIQLLKHNMKAASHHQNGCYRSMLISHNIERALTYELTSGVFSNPFCTILKFLSFALDHLFFFQPTVLFLIMVQIIHRGGQQNNSWQHKPCVIRHQFIIPPWTTFRGRYFRRQQYPNRWATLSQMAPGRLAWAPLHLPLPLWREFKAKQINRRAQQLKLEPGQTSSRPVGFVPLAAPIVLTFIENATSNPSWHAANIRYSFESPPYILISFFRNL
jgi:hypothetical protein